MSEPRWFEGKKGDVLAVECATCLPHPGRRWSNDYSRKNDACLGCKGSTWIVLATFEPIATQPTKPPNEALWIKRKEKR